MEVNKAHRDIAVGRSAIVVVASVGRKGGNAMLRSPCAPVW
jgi:hypothetical protein